MMKPNILNSSENSERSHSHAKHMWMMAVCCGLPIIGLLAFVALDFNTTLLLILIALICPIGMGIMMFKMMGGKEEEGEGHACCQPEKMEHKFDDICKDVSSTEKQAETLSPNQVTRPGSFMA